MGTTTFLGALSKYLSRSQEEREALVWLTVGRDCCIMALEAEG